MKTVREIVEEVADRRGVLVSDILGQCRVPHLVTPRHEVMYLARCEAERRRKAGQRKLSTNQIGNAINRHHSSVLYGANKYAEHFGHPKPWEV